MQVLAKNERILSETKQKVKGFAKINVIYLVATASVLELARVEAGAPTKEVVNLTSLDVVQKARNKERVDQVSVLVRLKVIGIVFVRRTRHWFLIVKTSSERPDGQL